MSLNVAQKCRAEDPKRRRSGVAASSSATVWTELEETRRKASERTDERGVGMRQGEGGGL